MRNAVFIVMTMAIVWPIVFFALPPIGFPLEIWALVASASVSAVFAGLLVMLGETIIENMILVCILLVLSGVVSTTTTKLGFIFVCALSSAFVGVLMNQINKAIANRPRWKDMRARPVRARPRYPRMRPAE